MELLFYDDVGVPRGADMPAGALSSSHIRFQAHHTGLAIHETLADTVDATMSRMRP